MVEGNIFPVYNNLLLLGVIFYLIVFSYRRMVEEISITSDDKSRIRIFTMGKIQDLTDNNIKNTPFQNPIPVFYL